MNDDKWGEILDKVEAQFEVLEQNKQPLPDVEKGVVEFIIFNGPIGRMKFERVSRPKIIDKKTFGGSKYGAASGVENIYSDTEVVKIFKAYKDQDGEWVPLDDKILNSNI